MGVLCVNTKSRRFKDTAKRLNIHPNSLEVYVHFFQNSIKDNFEEGSEIPFPSDEQILEFFSLGNRNYGTQAIDTWVKSYGATDGFITDSLVEEAISQYGTDSVHTYMDYSGNLVHKVSRPSIVNVKDLRYFLKALNIIDNKGNLLGITRKKFYERMRNLAIPASLYLQFDTELKNQVSLVFKRNPELAAIGTEEEYIQYLATIFPNSVDNSIYWHGSNEDFSEGFDSASRSKGSGAPETQLRNDFYLSKQAWSVLQYVDGVNRTSVDKNGFSHWNKLWWELKEIMSNGRRQNNDWKTLIINEDSVRQAIPNKKDIFNRDKGGLNGKWLKERKADYGYEDKTDREFFEEILGVKWGLDTFNSWVERNANIFKSIEESQKGIYPAIINVQNPIREIGQNTYYEEQRGLFTQAEKEGNDAILGEQTDNEFGSDVAVVLNNNNNVHFLGTTADKNAFSEFLGRNLSTVHTEGYTPEMQAIKEKAIADGTFMLAPNGKPTNLNEKQWLQVRTKAFKEWFGDWENIVLFTANNVDDIEALKQKYPSKLPNKFYHHSTNKFGKQTFDSREGTKEKLHIIGRLTTDKVDVLVVENPNSENKISHITLATTEGVKPFESNRELENNQNKIQPLDDYVDTTFTNNLRNDVSKVIDKNGEPLVVYHGTLGEFTIFDFNRLGEVTGQGYYTDHITGEKVPIDSSYAFFFTDNKIAAQSYKNLAIYNQNTFRKAVYQNLASVFLNNPYISSNWDFDEKQKEEQRNFIDNMLSPYMGFNVREQANKIIDGTSTLSDEKKKEFGNKFKEMSFKINRLPDARSISNREEYIQKHKKDLEFLKSNKEALLTGKDISYFEDSILSISPGYGNLANGEVYVTIGKDSDTNKYSVVGIPNSDGQIKPGTQIITEKNFDTIIEYWERRIEQITESLNNDKKLGHYDKGNVLGVFLNIKNPLEHDYNGSPFPDKYLVNAKEEEEGASYYGGEKTLKKPLIIDGKAMPTAYIAARQVRKARNEGNDGVVYKNVRDPFEMTSYGIFGANQVKSATDNIGTFSRENDDMYFQKSILTELKKLKQYNQPLAHAGSITKMKEKLKRLGIDSIVVNSIIKAVELDSSLASLTPLEIFNLITRQQEKGLAQQYNEYIQKPINKALEEHLLKFLEPFHVTSIEEDLMATHGVTGIYDIINKVIHLAKAEDRNSITVSEEVAHAIVELLGAKKSRKEENKDYTFLFDNIEATDIYKQVYEEYKDTYLKRDKQGNLVKDKDGNPIPDIDKIKKEAIGQALAVAINNKWQNTYAESEKSFWDKLKEWIEKIFQFFSDKEYINIDTLLNQIATEVIHNNYSRFKKVDSSKYSLLEYADTIANQNKQDGGKALEFMRFFSNEIGNFITGSIAYRKQGPVYRGKLDSLHDIDMVVPISVHNIPLQSTIVQQGIKKAYLSPELKAFLLNTDYFKKIIERYPKMKLASAFSDKAGGIVCNAVYSEDENLSERFINLSGDYATRLNAFTEEERKQIYLFDFFLENFDENYVYDKLYDINISDWKRIFKAKLEMGRAKDIFDYQMWDVYEEFKSEVMSEDEYLMLQKPIVYNPEQQEAIRQVSDYLAEIDPKEKFFLISGKAGCGKTFIINEIVKQAKEKMGYAPNVFITAVANKAVLNLGNKMDVPHGRKATASALGFYELDKSDGTKSWVKPRGWRLDRLPISKADILFIDECSMLDSSKLDMILQIKKQLPTLKIVMIGDRGQIHSIEEENNTNDAFSEEDLEKAFAPSPVFIYKNKREVQLVTRVRQGEDSPILIYADKFWDAATNGEDLPKFNGEKTIITKNGALITYKDTTATINEDAVESLVPIFKRAKELGNPDYAKIVALHVELVLRYNTAIYKALHPNADTENYPVSEGDMLMFYAPFGQDKDDLGNTISKFMNSSEIVVKKVLSEPYTLDAKDVINFILQVNPLAKGLEKYQNIKVLDILIDYKGKPEIVTIVCPSLDNIDAFIKLGRRLSILGDDLYRSGRAEEGRIMKDLRKQLEDKYAYVNYNYAISAHKSQGSTYQIVIVDYRDIKGRREKSAKYAKKKGDTWGGFTNKGEKAAIMYTALTRASNITIVLDSITSWSTSMPDINAVNELINKNRRGEEVSDTDFEKVVQTQSSETEDYKKNNEKEQQKNQSIPESEELDLTPIIEIEDEKWNAIFEQHNNTIEFIEATHEYWYYPQGKDHPETKVKMDTSVTTITNPVERSNRDKIGTQDYKDNGYGWLGISAAIGSSADRVVRDFFNGINITERKYPNFTTEQLKTLSLNLTSFRNWLSESEWLRGNKFRIVVNPFSVLGRVTKQDGSSETVGGTLDMLIYDERGYYYIIDFKTSRDSDLKGTSKIDHYTSQVCLYRDLLEAMHPELKGCCGGLGLLQMNTFYATPKGLPYKGSIGEIFYTVDNNNQLLANGTAIETHPDYIAPHFVDNNRQKAFIVILNAKDKKSLLFHIDKSTPTPVTVSALNETSKKENESVSINDNIAKATQIPSSDKHFSGSVSEEEFQLIMNGELTSLVKSVPKIVEYYKRLKTGDILELHTKERDRSLLVKITKPLSKNGSTSYQLKFSYVNNSSVFEMALNPKQEAPLVTKLDNLKRATVNPVSKQPFSANMWEEYGKYKREDISSKTTLDAIINGERTATTRTSHFDGFYDQMKEGDIVEFHDKNGRSILVRITKAPHKLSANLDLEEWSKKEGWTPERFTDVVNDNSGRTLLDYAEEGKAFLLEYEYISNSEVQPTPVLSKFDITISWKNDKDNYRKGTPQKHKDTAYLFTENALAHNKLEGEEVIGPDVFVITNVGKNRESNDRINQADIRTDSNGKKTENAFGLIVKKFQLNARGFVAQEGCFKDTDEDFELFKTMNLEMFESLEKSEYRKMVFPFEIALGKAALPRRFANWLKTQLETRYGIKTSIENNTTPGYKGYGLRVTSVKESQKTANLEYNKVRAGVEGENISSKGSEFAKQLTNYGNTVAVEFKGRTYRNAEHAYQTWKSGEFDEVAYNSTAAKPKGSKAVNKEVSDSIMVDILTAKLQQHPELVRGITSRGGIEYLNASTHDVIGDLHWETKNGEGDNGFIKALVKAYQNVVSKESTEEVIFNKDGNPETVSKVSGVTVTESTGSYAQRTKENADWSDITLALATDFSTKGETLTAQQAGSTDERYLGTRKPREGVEDKYHPISIANIRGKSGINATSYISTGNTDGKRWAETQKIKERFPSGINLNVAGNGIYTLVNGGISQEGINEYVTGFLSGVKQAGVNIKEVRSGGQTGVDEAGIIAAQRLGIPASIHAPKGFKFRNKDGVDISDKEQFLARFKQQSVTETPVLDNTNFDRQSIVKQLLDYLLNQIGLDIHGKEDIKEYIDSHNLSDEIVQNALEHLYEDEPLASYLADLPEEIIKGSLGVDKQQLISLLGSTMYKENVLSVAVKELLLNAFDAVKIANSTGKQNNPVIDITLNSQERTVTVSDNGIGMSPEIVQKAFFTIGGSYKGDNVDNRLKSGGLGLAKMAFLFSSDYVEVSTVKDGMETYVRATPELIQSDNFELITAKTSKPNGTTVTVKIPEYYIDDNGEKRNIYFDTDPAFLNKPMIGNVTVNVHTKTPYGERDKSYDKNVIPLGYQSIGKAKTVFGDLEIYVKPTSSYNVRSEILISGLYQFSHDLYLDGGQKGKFSAIINILPSVGVKSQEYPINNQREGFRSTVLPEIKDLDFLLKLINTTLEKKSLREAFGNAVSMLVSEVAAVERKPASNTDIVKDAMDEIAKTVFNTEPKTESKTDSDNTLDLKIIRTQREQQEKSRRSSFDSSGIRLNDETVSTVVDTSNLDINKPIFHNNTTMKIEEDGLKVLNELGILMLQLKSLYSQTYQDAGIKSRFSDNVVDYINKQYWGISFDKNYGGVNVSPVIMSFLAINPFYILVPSYKGIDASLYLTQCIIHLIEHEFNHNYASGEGASFTGRLPRTEAEFAGIGESFKEWTDRLYKLISDNLNTFIKYGKEYEKSTNVGESFEANKLTRTDESGDSSLEDNGSELSEYRSGESVSGYGEEFRGIYESGQRQLERALQSDVISAYRTPDGDLYGFVDYEGEMYFDETVISPEHPIHEYTHLWDRVVAKINPKLWKLGVELLKQTPLWEEIESSKEYGEKWRNSNLTKESIEFMIASEVHSRLVGSSSEAVIRNLAKESSDNIIDKIRAWLKEFWETLKETFSNWSPEELNDLTLEQFEAMPIRDFIELPSLQAILTAQFTQEEENAEPVVTSEENALLNLLSLRGLVETVPPSELYTPYELELIKEREELNALKDGKDTIFKPTELTDLAKACMFLVSDFISQIQLSKDYNEQWFQYLDDANPRKQELLNTDFTQMTRIEICQKLGSTMYAVVQNKYFNALYNPNRNALTRDLRKKLRYINKNFNAFLELGEKVLMDNEGILYDNSSVQITTEDEAIFDGKNVEEIIEIAGSAVEHWQINFRGVSAHASLSLLIKRTVGTLFELDENFQQVSNAFGIPNRIDSSLAINNILMWTLGSENLPQMIEKLKEKEKLNHWLRQIITKLDSNSEDEVFKSQFWSNFKKYFQPYIILYQKTIYNANGEEIGSVLTNKIINKRTLEEQMLDDFLSLQQDVIEGVEGAVIPLLNQDGTINKDILKQYDEDLKVLQEYVNTFKEDLENAKASQKHIAAIERLYKYFGITLDEATVKNLADDYDTVKSIYTSVYYIKTKKGLDNALKRNIKNFDISENHRGDLQALFSHIVDSSSTTLESVSYEDGKMHYSYVVPSYLTNLVEKLKGNTEDYNRFLEENYGKYGWFKIGDQWRNEILRVLSEDEEARKEFGHFVTLTTRPVGATVSVGYQDKSPILYEKSMLQNYFYGGAKSLWALFRMPIMSNKPSEEYIRFKRNINSTYKEDIAELLVNVALQEIDRIATVRQRNSDPRTSKIKNFDSNGKKFLFLDYLQPILEDYLEWKNDEKNEKSIIQLGVDEQDNIVGYVNGTLVSKELLLGQMLEQFIQGEYADNNENSPNFDNKTQFNSLLTTVIKEQMDLKFQEYLKDMREIGLLEQDKKKNYIHFKDLQLLPNFSVEENLENFFWNDTFMAISILQLTITDIAYYKNAEDLQKRLAQLHAPGLRGNKYARWKMNGEMQPIMDGKTRTVYIADFDAVISDAIENIKQVFERRVEALRKINPEAADNLRLESERIIEAFEGINVTDAQGYNSITSYRKKAIAFGKWTDELEEVYTKIRSGKYDTKDLQAVMQPLKPFIYSNTTKLSVGRLGQLKVGMQNKNSEYLILLMDAILLGEENTGNPTNSKLAAIYKVMEESHYDSEGNYQVDGIDTVQFNSTVKTGETGVIDINMASTTEEAVDILRKAIYNNGLNKKSGYNLDSVHELDFDDYCLQSEVPAHLEGDSIFGSQMRILSISDMPEIVNGVEQYVQYRNKPTLLSEVKQNYMKAIARNIEQSLLEIIDQFKITGTKPERNVALSRLLLEQIKKDGRFGYDLLYSISTDENGNFNIPLSDPVNAGRVLQLLHSLIKNRINKQMIEGGPVVLVTNYGTSSELDIVFKDKEGNRLKTLREWYREQDFSLFGDISYEEFAKLHRYKNAKKGTEGYRLYNEIYVPLRKIVSERYNKEIASKQAGILYIECYMSASMFKQFADENGIVDLNKIPDYMKEIIGFRIPTEFKYSMAPLKVVGLLPIESGEGIMLPKDITILSGSDFDIDKLYIIRPSVRLNEFKIRQEYKKLQGKKYDIKAVWDDIYENFPEVTQFIQEGKKALYQEWVDNGYTKSYEEFLEEAKKRGFDKEHKWLENSKEVFEQALSMWEDADDYVIDKGIQMSYREFRESKKSDPKYYLKVENDNTKLGRDNIIFDTIWAMLTSEQAMDQIFTPGNFDEPKKWGYIAEVIRLYPELTYSQILSLYEEAEKELVGTGIDKLKDLISSSKNLVYNNVHLAFHKLNMVAAKLIGIFAQNNVSHSIISLIDQTYVRDSEGNIIKDDNGNPKIWRPTIKIEDPILIIGSDIIGGEELPFDRLYDKLGKRISNTLAALLAASVDAVKDPVLNFMNINESTAGILTTLIRMGYDLELAMLLLTQPIVKDVISNYIILNESSSVSLDTVILNKIDEINKDKISISKLDTPNISKEYLIKTLKEATIADNINILRALSALNEISRVTSAIVSLTKFNSVTAAAGPMLSNTILMKQRIIENLSRSELDTASMQHALSNPIIKTFRDSEFLAVDLLFSGMMLQGSSQFDNIVLKVLEIMNGRLDDKLINKLSDFYIAFLLARGNNPIFKTDSNPDPISKERRDYLYKELPKEIKKLKKDKNVNSRFLKILQIKPSDDSHKRPWLTVNTRGMQATTHDVVGLYWQELYQDNPKIAMALIEYNFLVSGLGFTPTSFANLIPIALRKAIPNYILQLNTSGTLNKFEEDRLIEQFVQNNWSNTKIVKPVYLKDEKVSSGNVYILIDSKESVIKKSFDTYLDYILYKNKLYKFDGEKGFKVKYVEIPKLGGPYGEILEINPSDKVQPIDFSTKNKNGNSKKQGVQKKDQQESSDDFNVEVEKTRTQKKLEENEPFITQIQWFIFNRVPESELSKRISRLRRAVYAKKTFAGAPKRALQSLFNDYSATEYNKDLLERIDIADILFNAIKDDSITKEELDEKLQDIIDTENDLNVCK